jgi:hypothetical protein
MSSRARELRTADFTIIEIIAVLLVVANAQNSSNLVDRRRAKQRVVNL